MHLLKMLLYTDLSWPLADISWLFSLAFKENHFLGKAYNTVIVYAESIIVARFFFHLC